MARKVRLFCAPMGVFKHDFGSKFLVSLFGIDLIRGLDKVPIAFLLVASIRLTLASR